jgi:hypothetical protein
MSIVRKEPEPKLPWDDALWDFRPATGAGDALCRQLERASVVSKIIGCDQDEAMKIVASARCPPAIEPVRSNSVLSTLLKRVAHVHETTAQRKAVIKGLVDAVRNRPAFKRVRDDDRWNKLANSLDNYIASAIIAP